MAIDDWTGGADTALPADDGDAALAGRIRLPGVGPRVVAVRGRSIIDVGDTFPTMSALAEAGDPAESLRAAHGATIGTVDDILRATTTERRSCDAPRLLAPIDLQVIKAAGVTFPVSMIERVIEERAGGDPARAADVRERIATALGGDISSLVPGSPEAGRLKEYLMSIDAWSQYLEVGIGPDAEVFTKAPVLSAVGTADEIGVLSTSSWNNPEPELVLIVGSTGRVVGATLGNDVNLRDIEGRSALLLGRAKDNNGSAALGPFIRFFDADFGLADVRAARIDLRVQGRDGFVLEDRCDMSRISRDPVDLVRQVLGAHHQYPDGFVLFLGTPFAPIVDRDVPGRGFTHHVGDVVRIGTPRLGTLVNRVAYSESLPPWEYGIAELFSDLLRSQHPSGAEAIR